MEWKYYKFIIRIRIKYFKKNRQGFSVIQLSRGIAPFYPLMRTNVSWKNVVQLEPSLPVTLRPVQLPCRIHKERYGDSRHHTRHIYTHIYEITRPQ